MDLMPSDARVLNPGVWTALQEAGAATASRLGLRHTFTRGCSPKAVT